MPNLTVTRAAGVAPTLDGVELRYGAPDKCKAEVSDDGKINGSFRSKVAIRSLQTKKSTSENDVVWFNYAQHDSSLSINYVSVGKSVVGKASRDRKGQALLLSIIEEVRYAPSEATVPYALHRGGRISIALSYPTFTLRPSRCWSLIAPAVPMAFARIRHIE